MAALNRVKKQRSLLAWFLYAIKKKAKNAFKRNYMVKSTTHTMNKRRIT